MPEPRAHPVTKTRNLTKPKFEDQELCSLAESFGTPYFLIDEAVLRKNVSEIEQAYQGFKGPFRVAYSIKANFNPAVIKTFVVVVVPPLVVRHVRSDPRLRPPQGGAFSG